MLFEDVIALQEESEVIKIDMMFLEEMEEMSGAAVVLRNMINMMNELGLVPLTEGIETEGQYRLLSRMGCKMFQGYLFAKPLPEDRFEDRYLNASRAS